MAQTVQLKRSAVSGKIPLTTDIALGEIAVNTYDGKLFIKKDDGVESIVEVTGSTDLSISANSSSVTVLSNTGTDGILLGANTTAAGILTADAQTIAGDKTFTSSINVTGIYANNSLGASGQVLATNGSTTYWSTPAEGSGGNSFTTIAVSGQSNVVADSPTDTLTLVAGTGVTLTTDAATDSITISSSGGSGGAINDLFYENATTVTANYTISTNKNAMTTGPLTIADGVSVTVPTNSRWVII